MVTFASVNSNVTNTYYYQYYIYIYIIQYVYMYIVAHIRALSLYVLWRRFHKPCAFVSSSGYDTIHFLTYQRNVEFEF